MAKEKENTKNQKAADDPRTYAGSDANLLNDEMYGKVPPHSKEMELAVLGGMMMDNKLIDVVQGILKHDQFYVTANQMICKAIYDLRAEKAPADLVTVTEKLRAMGELEAVGGPIYLTEIFAAVAFLDSIEYQARKLYEMYLKRDMILLTFSLNEMCYDPTVDTVNLIESAQREIVGMGGNLYADKQASLDEAFKEMLEDAEQRESKQGEDKMSGIPCYIEEFNDMTGGFQRGELHIIAGRPSHGKSAAAFKQALYSAEHGYHVGVFSIEQAQRELMARIAAMDQEIDMIKFKKGGLTTKDFEKLSRTLQKMKDLREKLLLDFRNPLTLPQLRTKCREWKVKYGLDMVIVDYTQLMESGESKRKWESTNNEIGYITRGLKQIAKELDVAVIALSQMSRKIEDRGIENRKPTLADLRDSGNIEQDADLVLFITRPEIWYSKDDPKCAQWKGIGLWDIAKQRNGPVGELKTLFRGAFGSFVNYSSEFEPSLPGNYNHPENGNGSSQMSREQEPF